MAGSSEIASPWSGRAATARASSRGSWAPRPGETLDGRYRLIREIRSDTAEAVLQARDFKLGRDVEVHAFRPELFAGPLADTNFARLYLARAHFHPRIPLVHDIVDGRAGIYATTTLARGVPLPAWLEAQGVPEPATRPRLVRGLLSALAAVHRVGAHGNLRPETIRVADDLIELTSPWYLAGQKPPAGDPWTAPEQRSPDWDGDKRTDIRAAAMLIGYLRAGHTIEPGTPLSSQGIDAGEALDRLFLQATSPLPEARHESVEALTRAWQRSIVPLRPPRREQTPTRLPLPIARPARPHLPPPVPAPELAPEPAPEPTKPAAPEPEPIEAVRRPEPLREEEPAPTFRLRPAPAPLREEPGPTPDVGDDDELFADLDPVLPAEVATAAPAGGTLAPPVVVPFPLPEPAPRPRRARRPGLRGWVSTVACLACLGAVVVLVQDHRHLQRREALAPAVDAPAGLAARSAAARTEPQRSRNLGRAGTAKAEGLREPVDGMYMGEWRRLDEGIPTEGAAEPVSLPPQATAPATGAAVAPEQPDAPKALRAIESAPEPEACPGDMARIAPRRGDPFCVDRFEAPGEGHRPTTNVTRAGASGRCKAMGRRLCSLDELRAACGRFYPYGRTYEEEACNVGKGGTSETALTTTGAFPRCRSEWGVADLVGNAAEWTSDGYVYGGSALSPGKRSLCSRAKRRRTAHDTVGFRCCTEPAGD